MSMEANTKDSLKIIKSKDRGPTLQNPINGKAIGSWAIWKVRVSN